MNAQLVYGKKGKQLTKNEASEVIECLFAGNGGLKMKKMG